MKRLVIAFVVVGLFVACAAPRLTQELVWPGADGEPDRLVVRWPEGVVASQVYTLDASTARALSTAPLPEGWDNPK